MVRVCSIDSTAQGPATRTSSEPPTGTFPTWTTLDSLRTSRETSLYAWETGMTSRTPGRLSKIGASRAPLFPVIPMAVRCVPGMAWALKPRASMASIAPRICSGVASCRITTSTGVSSANPDSSPRGPVGALARARPRRVAGPRCYDPRTLP